MFCTQCGAELQDGAKFCIKCGSPVEGSPAAGRPAGAGPVTAPVHQKPGGKMDQKKLFMIGAAALVVIVVFAIGSLFKGDGKGGAGSPEEAFDTYFAGFCEQDFDRMLEVYPEFVIEYYGGENAMKAELRRNYASQIGIYADAGWQVVFTATDHTMWDKDRVKEISEGMSEIFGAKIKYSAAATIIYDIDMIYQDGVTKKHTDSLSDVYAVQYKGKWYFFNSSL